MPKLSRTLIRAMLQDQQDGMTSAAIAARLSAHPSSVISALRRMPDCYIDRWQQSGKTKYAAVWCAITPPADCPHPRKPENQDHGHHAA